MSVQTILISKHLYSLRKAMEWIALHGYHYKKVDITNNYYRFRQIPPKKSYKYFSKTVTKGIIFVFIES